VIAEAQDLRQVGARIEQLLGGLQSVGDPATREKAEQLVRALIELYGAGLDRMITIVAADDAGSVIVERLADDELVAGLLLLHGLHPVALETRIERALEKVRPYLGSHAGGVEFLGVDDDGMAHLRLEGSCKGCPSSTVTVKLAIERAVLEAAPEIVGIAVEGMTEEKPSGPPIIPIESIRLVCPVDLPGGRRS